MTTVSPRVPPQEEVLGYIPKVNNWGRWGRDDQLGTLNLITSKKRVQAASLVKDGLAVSCSRLITTEIAADVTAPFQHFMTGVGQGVTGQGGSSDFYGMNYHGYYYTHLDSLCHIFYDGLMYNGRSASLVTTREFAKANSVDAVHAGVVTRGVLLDITKVRKVKWMEPGQGIFPEDLEAAEKAGNVRVEEGDALLVRTGFWRFRTESGAIAPGKGRPGLHAACLPWLHRRGVALIASDAVNDLTPSGYPDLNLPMHQIGIVRMGLWLVDNGNFDELAATCEAKERREFMFMLSPLRVAGGTGSPANPLAVF